MAVVDENRYKSNSYKSRAAEEEKKEIQKVVKGNVRKHEKTTGEKIRESFFGENVDNIGDYLIFDVLLPSAKEILDTFVTSAKDIILYGEVREQSSRSRGGRGSYVSYDGYSRGGSIRRKKDREISRRARFDFTDIEFDDLDDIDEVIRELKDVWSVYNEIQVAHFYQAAGYEVSPIDYKWGWLDVRAFTTADAYKVKSRNPDTGEIEVKWVLDLPKPKPLDY